MDEIMTRQEMAREIAFLLDEDGVTNEDIDETMTMMRERIAEGDGGYTMAANLIALEDAKAELDYWTGTAAEYEEEQGTQEDVPLPAPLPRLYSRIFVVDDNRQGVAREQVVEILSAGALGVIERDLQDAGFSRIVAIGDGTVSAGTSLIYYKPDADQYVSKSAWAQDINMLFEALTRKGA